MKSAVWASLRKVLVASSWLIFSPLHAEPMNLSATIDKILAYQPLLRIEKEKLHQIDAQQNAILAGALPALNATGSWIRKDDALNGQSVLFNGEAYNTYNGGLEVTIPIYSGGKVTGARRAARKDEQLQNLSIQKTQRDLIIQGISLFHKILLAERKLETAERLKDIQQKLLALAQRRYRVGSETRLTVLQIKTELGLVEPQITLARNDLSLLGAELADMAGLANLKELSIQGRLGPWELDVAPERKIEERPEWRSLQLNLARIDDERTVTLAKHFPQISGFANLTRGGYKLSDLGDQDATGWNAGLRLTVPIFSGLQSLYERRELRSRETQLELQSQDLAKNMELDRVRALQGFENAKEVEKASLFAFNEAQEAVKVAQSTYQVGTTSYLQASETQKQLADAERSYAQSEFQLLEAFTNCYVANGWDVSELPKTIETALVAAKGAHK